MTRVMKTPGDAARVLVELGATPWLVRHHELVVEAAAVLCRELAEVTFDRDAVLVGAALHDAGKIVVPREMTEPGSEHEQAGRALLIEHGVADALARFCVTHAAWDAIDCTIEDLLVALADKLWKGKRVDALEQLVVARIARTTGQEAWAVFDQVDRICETIAADGPSRLARSAT